METRSTEVDGIQMRWAEQEGEGPAVILIHGIPTSPALWRRVMPKISRGRVLAWEMVGYGGSIPEGRTRDLSLSRQADYLRAWMRELGIERAVLVGHDLGGGVAQILALREPSLCAGLVLTNAVGYDSWPVRPVKAMRAAGGITSRLPDPLLKATLGYLMARGHDDPKIARESLDVHFRPYAEHDGGRALVREMRALDARDTLNVQAQIPTLRGTPARVVWGAADRFQKIRYGERFAEDLGCPLIRIERGKHFVPEDHPDVLASAINEVVAEGAPEASA